MSRLVFGMAALLFVLSTLCPRIACAQFRMGATEGSGGAVQRYIFDRPTVSPYLNLVRDSNSSSGLPNYQTLVRPALEQRQRNIQQQRQINRLQTDLNTTRRAFTRAKEGFQTGHPTRFMTYLHYYPTLGQR